MTKNNFTSIGVTLKSLRENALFYAFGESKENFHSSFWLWMFSRNREETVRILTGSKVKECKIFEFERERNFSSKNEETSSINKSRCDVVINTEEYIYVFEVKVKAYPTKEQLTRIYDSVINSKEVQSNSDEKRLRFICIHLYPKETLSKLDASLPEWNFIDFKALAQNINPSNFSNNDKMYIQDYKNLVNDLSSLFNEFKFDNKNSNYDFTINKAREDGLFKLLDEVKLWELYVNYRSKHFFGLLKDKLENEFKAEKLIYETAINHKKSTISFGIILNEQHSAENVPLNLISKEIEKDKDLVILGVQIEDTQFRKFVYAHKPGRYYKYFEDCHFVKDLRGKGRPRKDKPDDIWTGYGQYFRYKYEKLEANLTCEDVSKKLIEAFKFITEHKTKILTCEM